MRATALETKDEPIANTGIETVSYAVDLLKLSRRDRAATVCDGVIDITSALFNVSGRDVRQPGRSTLDISRVRQVGMYVAHVTLGISMRDVGEGFGRDRTTVLYACHQIEDLRDDAEFDSIVAMMERVVLAVFGRMDRD
ncbi:helix-turn-helix domain-containing protein [Mesorhizobium sp. CAU 1732]|uniref:helix-turn-helix domain-containing protein n=1 Tax=Mesorhizobium sp. CAU 1732 TaxID=3140358 RepID=UPI0032611791